MQRTLLIVLATAVVAAGIATGATIVLTGDDDELAITSPLPAPTTPAATTQVITPSPGTTATASPTPAPGTTDRPGEDRSATTERPVRSAKSVDCDKEPKFCSATDRLTVTEDKVASFSKGDPPSYSGVATITLRSEARDRRNREAGAGDDAGSIHVEVVVENKTDKTFVFPEREIVLEIFRNGERFDSFATKGDGFEMTPRSKMNGTFDRPVTDDGDYSWHAKVWYYEK